MDLPGMAAIRRRALIPRERDGALLELAFLERAVQEGLKPEILSTPDCRIWVAGRPVYVELRYRRGPVTVSTVREEALQLRRAEAENEPGIIVFGGPGAAPMTVLQTGLAQVDYLSAIVLWNDPLVVVSRKSTLRGMALRQALRAALD
jgi:hypothetical protein